VQLTQVFVAVVLVAQGLRGSPVKVVAQLWTAGNSRGRAAPWGPAKTSHVGASAATACAIQGSGLEPTTPLSQTQRPHLRGARLRIFTRSISFFFFLPLVSSHSLEYLYLSYLWLS
jgi:hypothetical protein